MIETGLSPCPNDTFLFYAWIHGLVGKEHPIKPFLADVETLNQQAFKQKLPLTKLSFGAYKYVGDHYDLLPTGAALGWNCGPKIIASRPFSLEELSDKSIAIPGRYTTAHLLLEKLFKHPFKKHFCSYDEVEGLVKKGFVDAGLIIHESRFTFALEGLYEIADLGEIWHEKTHLPLPLGGIFIRKDLHQHYKREFIKALQDSLLYGQDNPDKLLPYILQHSRVKEKSIVEAHIALYITKDTFELSNEGQKAIDLMLS